MSDYTVVRAVTLTMRHMLEDAITNSTDPQLNGVLIDLRSPKEMRQVNANGVSLWLYRVNRDPDLLNDPPHRISPTEFRAQSLPVNLFYLITPLVQLPEDRQTVLGRVLQTFNDRPVARGADLRDTLLGSDEEFRLTLETLSLEELTRVWHALAEPYDLSVTYAVQIVRIDSDLEPLSTTPVLIKRSTYTQIRSVT